MPLGSLLIKFTSSPNWPSILTTYISFALAGTPPVVMFTPSSIVTDVTLYRSDFTFDEFPNSTYKSSSTSCIFFILDFNNSVAFILNPVSPRTGAVSALVPKRSVGAEALRSCITVPILY